MNSETFFKHFATFAEAPNGVAKLREMILQLAVHGKLVPQDPNDEAATNLRERILTKRKQMIEAGEFGPFATDAKWPDGALPYTLPKGWDWIRFGELGGFLGGGTPSKERAEYWDGKIPWVSPKDMKRPYIDDAIDHISELGVENCSGKMIPKQSLLMVVRGMILAHSFPVAMAMRPLTINQDMKALQLSLPEISEYMLRCCAAIKSRMLTNVERSSHGTCRLPTSAVANFAIPLPPLAEQARIVQKVDQLFGLCDELESRQAARREVRSRLVGATLDRLVSTSSTAEFPKHVNRVRDQFDRLFDTPTTIPQLRQTILQLAVQGKLVSQDPNDEPAKLSTKDDSTPEPTTTVSKDNSSDIWPFQIPINWRWIRLRDTPAELKYGTSVKCDYSGLGVPVLRIPNMVAGRVDLSDMKYGQLTDKERNDLSLEKGNLLLIRSNGSTSIVGRTAVVCEDAVSYAYAGYLVRIRFSSSTWFPEFLHLAMISRATREQIEGPIRTTSGVKNINSTEIGRLMLPLPPLAEQKRIVEKVDQLMSLCDQLESKLTETETQSTLLLSAAVHHLLSDSISA